MSFSFDNFHLRAVLLFISFVFVFSVFSSHCHTISIQLSTFLISTRALEFKIILDWTRWIMNWWQMGSAVWVNTREFQMAADRETVFILVNALIFGQSTRNGFQSKNNTQVQNNCNTLRNAFLFEPCMHSEVISIMRTTSRIPERVADSWKAFTMRVSKACLLLFKTAVILSHNKADE